MTIASESSEGREVLVWSFPDRCASSPGELPAPLLFRPAAPLESVSCGGALVAFVTADKKLYLMELGSELSKFDSAPRLVEALRQQDILQVSCGSGGRVVAMSSSGAAFEVRSPSGLEAGVAAGIAAAKAVAGSVGGLLASFGRLHRLQMPLQAQRVSCGGAHVLLLAEPGILFSFGDGQCGQLGLGAAVRSTSVPTCVEALAQFQVCDVAAGSAHSCAATTYGNLFTWGDNYRGQLGDGTLASKWNPSLIGSVEFVTAVAADEASAALTAMGAVFAWGFSGRVEPIPVSLGGRRVQSIALSSEVLCARSHENELLMVNLQLEVNGGAINGLGAPWLAHGAVASLSASGRHVVALTLSQVSLSSPSPQQVVPNELRADVGLSTLGMSQAAGQFSIGLTTHSREPVTADQFSAQMNNNSTNNNDINNNRNDINNNDKNNNNNHRLEEAVEELRAQSAELRRAVEEADSRFIRVGAELSREQAQVVQLRRQAESVGIHEELQMLRAELARELQEDEVETEFLRLYSIAPVWHDPSLVGEPLPAAIQDLREKCGLLRREELRLRREDDCLAADVLSVRAELAESKRHLHGIEDACSKARATAEQHQLLASAMAQEARAEEEQLRMADSEVQQQLAADECRELEAESLRLSPAEGRLSHTLSEVQGALRARHLDNNNSSSNGNNNNSNSNNNSNNLPSAERLQRSVTALRGEFFAAQRRAQELSDSLAHAAAKQLEARRQVLGEMRRHLAGELAVEQGMEVQLFDRAQRFAEETGKLYAEVQELHQQQHQQHQQHQQQSQAATDTAVTGRLVAPPPPPDPGMQRQQQLHRHHNSNSNNNNQDEHRARRMQLAEAPGIGN
ncbi:unnamed protein product [Polarella glacialis]|uniref:Uncharacterized protein n=1 Tax=Polarella glacialis TaxID=89957 RepID=A0A813JL04_POLGL|nr:unnamed protein product [Polarella glacialis]